MWKRRRRYRLHGGRIILEAAGLDRDPQQYRLNQLLTAQRPKIPSAHLTKKPANRLRYSLWSWGMETGTITF